MQDEGCRACHHAGADDNLIFEHIFPFMPDDKDGVKDAYHERCISCHEERIAVGGKYGPVTCGECHDKKRLPRALAVPVVNFDYYYHDKHVIKLKNKCDPCHHSYDKNNGELVYEEGTEQSCYYCHDLNAKRGPFLASELELTKNKNLTMRKVSHTLCVNCHLRSSKRNEEAGPLECARCHTGQYRTLEELRIVPRPDRDQPQKTLITIEGGMMRGVLFNHESHGKASMTCRTCHHETLNACKKCHTLAGSAEGKWVTTVNAYHHLYSRASCAGCHASEKTEKNCAGCHHLLDVDIQTKGPKKEFCSGCHSGEEKVPARREKIQISRLIEEKVPDKVTISVLENEYGPATFPHGKIIRRLVSISNASGMATAFHRDIDSICEGCHHQSFPEAEAEQRKPPYCRNCHSITFDMQNMNRPRLLAAYHRQCLGCHERMNIGAMECGDCHMEKSKLDVVSRNMTQREMILE